MLIMQEIEKSYSLEARCSLQPIHKDMKLVVNHSMNDPWVDQKNIYLRAELTITKF